MSSKRGLLAEIVPASCVDGPGNRYAVFLQGCTFNCLVCHNPHTIARHPVATSRWIDVEQILDGVRDEAPFISGVTVSGGEATCQWMFVQELFRRIKTDSALSHLTTLVDSNGDAEPCVWDALAPWMDGVMVDLKALDPIVHRFLTGRDNQRVMASIEHLAGIGKLHEVRLLLVRDVNDSDQQLTRTAEWLIGVDPAVAVRVLGFRRVGARPVAERFEEPTPAHLQHAVDVLVRAGVRADAISVWPP